MSIELIEAPTIENTCRVTASNGVRARVWVDEGTLSDREVNITLNTAGGSLMGCFCVNAARELAAALLLCADSVESQ